METRHLVASALLSLVVLCGAGWLIESRRAARLAGRVEVSTTRLEEERDRARSALDALRSDLDASSAQIEEQELRLRELERQLTELGARVRELAEAPRASAARSDPGPALDPPVEPTSGATELFPESAETAEARTIESSPYPFLAFDELPPHARDSYALWEDCALFLEYPENRWGRRKIGRVGFRKKVEGEWRFIPLDDENGPLVRKMAELTYEAEARMTANIAGLYRRGDGRRFSNEEAARLYVRGLGLSSRHPAVRIDPATGEAWVFAYDDVNEGIAQIRARRERIGEQLVRGSSGSYGATWIEADPAR